MSGSMRLAWTACAVAACGSRGSQPVVPAVTSARDAGPGTNTSSSIVTVPPTPEQGCPATRADAWRDPGTVHGATIVGNETWTAEGSPHRLPHGATIALGASVTLVPCALVLAGRGTAFTVAAGGAIFAMGDAHRPIRITVDAPDAEPGAWDGVVVAQGSRSTSRMMHTRIERGGAHGAGLEIDAPEADLEHVSVTFARGAGVHLGAGGSFATYAVDLHVSATTATDRDDGVPIHFDNADAVGTLPTGDLHGNARDAVRIGATEPLQFVRHTQTWRDAGVPYALDARRSLHIDDTSAPQLAIAANATLLLGQDDAIIVGQTSHAALSIDGTANALVHLRPRGDESWRGIELGAQSDRERTHLHGVSIDGAIGLSLDAQTCAPRDINSAVIVARFEPHEDLLADVTLNSIAPNTAFVARAWSGTDIDVVGASVVLPANACAQTLLRRGSRACPHTVACAP